MSKTTNILMLSITFLMLSVVSTAQNNLRKDSAVLIINSSFQPFLTDALKIKGNPSINDTSKIIPKLNYSFIDNPIEIAFNVEPITAARIKGEPLVKLYRGYAKIGFGTNTTPLVELYYNEKRSKTFSYGFFGKHFSSQGISGYKPLISNLNATKYSHNHLSFFGKHFSKQFTTIGKASYTRNVNHYYGISRVPLEKVGLNNNSIKQKVDKFDVAFSLARNFTDSSQFDYNVDVGFHNLKDRFAVTENHLEVAGNLSKYHQQELYSIGIEANYNKLINPLSLDRNLVLGINPMVSTSTKKWQFKVGIGLYLNSFPDTKFHFYPKAEFKLNVVENIIIPYAGIKGGLISNNFNNFYNENPFINSEQLVTQNSNQKHDIYGGIRGNLSSKVTFNTSFSQQKVEGLPLYVKGLGDFLENKFVLAYDTVNISTITGEITYQSLEKIRLVLDAKYFNYSPKNELKAWHKPNLKISLTGFYDLSNKIIVRADFFYFSKQYAKSYSTIAQNNTTTTTLIAQKLSSIFDANIGLEYRYTKKLSAYINFNNIGSFSYQRYQDYPTQRFGVLGGLTYSF